MSEALVDLFGCCHRQHARIPDLAALVYHLEILGIGFISNALDLGGMDSVQDKDEDGGPL